MTHDTRLALIDSDGDARYPAIINGSFQIGKGRDQLTTRIEDYGRFVCADGRKPGILKFSGRAKEASNRCLASPIATGVGPLGPDGGFAWISDAFLQSCENVINTQRWTGIAHRGLNASTEQLVS